jgi:hypothetical protein
MDTTAIHDFLDSLRAKISGLLGKAPAQSDEIQHEEIICCDPANAIHIAFRGVADDRLYVTYNRRYPELRYYKPHGLRAFCAKCRRRIL